MDFCSLCGNNEERKLCGACDHFECFHPNPLAVKYFVKSGKPKGQLQFIPGGPELEATATIKKGKVYVCPYCGGYSHLIPQPLNYPGYPPDNKRYCCLCSGALAELEYKKRVRTLQALQARQFELIEKQFESELTFHSSFHPPEGDKSKSSAAASKAVKNTYFKQTPAFKSKFDLLI